MPNRAQGRSGFAIVELIIMLVVLALVWWFVVRPIDKYLGTNSDPKTLVGNIEENNAFHREQYTKIACELYMIKERLTTVPDPFPGPGPTSRPTSPPPRP